MNRITSRQKIFSIALLMACFLAGLAVASLLSWITIGKLPDPMFPVLLGMYMALGAIGFVRPDPHDMGSFLKALRTSAIWPYLAWRKQETLYLTQQDSSSSDRYVVLVNDVVAGELSGPDYASIRLQVFRDPRSYIAQVLNLFKVFWAALNQLLWAVPTAVFWFAVVLAVFWPDDYLSILKALQSGPEAIQSAMSFVVSMATLVLFFYISLGFALGYRLGFRNHFAETVALLIRQRCGIAADGKLSVVLRASLSVPSQSQ